MNSKIEELRLLMKQIGRYETHEFKGIKYVVGKNDLIITRLPFRVSREIAKSKIKNISKIESVIKFKAKLSKQLRFNIIMDTPSILKEAENDRENRIAAAKSMQLEEMQKIKNKKIVDVDTDEIQNDFNDFDNIIFKEEEKERVVDVDIDTENDDNYFDEKDYDDNNNNEIELELEIDLENESYFTSVEPNDKIDRLTLESQNIPVFSFTPPDTSLRQRPIARKIELVIDKRLYKEFNKVLFAPDLKLVTSDLDVFLDKKMVITAIDSYLETFKVDDKEISDFSYETKEALMLVLNKLHGKAYRIKGLALPKMFKRVLFEGVDKTGQNILSIDQNPELISLFKKARMPDILGRSALIFTLTSIVNNIDHIDIALVDVKKHSIYDVNKQIIYQSLDDSFSSKGFSIEQFFEFNDRRCAIFKNMLCDLLSQFFSDTFFLTKKFSYKEYFAQEDNKED